MKNTGRENSDKEELHKYQCERYSHHKTRCEKLDDLAFKTSERYDQWVLTLSGGALAVSLTFLEKFAPHPSPISCYILLAAWICLVSSLVLAFWAINTSRDAIYRQMEIAREGFKFFMDTSKPEKIEGDEFEEPENKFSKRLKWVNLWSGCGVALGLLLLCVFAFLNLQGVATAKTETSSQVNTNANVQNVSPVTNVGANISTNTKTNNP